jgi:Acetyltransferase (GNAT) domain
MSSARDGQLTLRVARSVNEIEEIRGIWTEWQSNPISDIDNYLSLMRSRPEIESPHVMLIYRDSCLDSILVGRLERTRISCALGYLKLFQPEVRTLCISHEGFLGNQSAENSRFITREIVKCLSRGEAGVARFDYLGIDSSLFEEVKGVPGILCRDHFASTQPHGCLRLQGSFEEFTASLSRKERHNLKRYAGRVKADFPGKMRIQSFRREEQVEDLIRDTEEVAKKTYQRGLGVGFQDDLETRQLLRTAARKGTLRGCIMYLGDYPAAFMIGIQYRQALHGIAMGYDPQYNEYSLGSLVLMHWIQEAFEASGSQAVSEIDLGAGDGRHKRAIYNHTWHESLAYIFAPTPKGLLLNFLKTATYLMDQGLKKLLLKTGFLEKIKKVWRSSVPGAGRAGSSRAIPGLQLTRSAESSDPSH